MDTTTLAGAKVMVIGASSFIGSHLVPELKQQGAIVFTANRSESFSSQGALTHRTLDITDLASVERVLEEVMPDYIFNLSGHVQGGRAIEHVWPAFKVNLEGTVNLLTTLKRYPCKRLIILGSLDEHQPNNQLIQPVSPYAASKIAASAYARMFHLLFETPVVIAQLFMVYGPNQKDQLKLVPYTILSILKGEIPSFSSGSRKADWVYVKDVVDGLTKIATFPGIEGATIQFGTGRLAAVEEVVSKLFELLKVNTHPKFGAIEDRKAETIIAANVDETKQLIGWGAKISLEEGLKKTVSWYKEQFEKSLK